MSRYDVRRMLRVGGMGIVHEAVRTGPGGAEKAFAIKRIRPDLRAHDEVARRFEHEGRLHWDLPSHPNVVTLHDFACSQTGEPYMVMEVVDGVSLREVMSAYAAPLPHAVTRYVLCEVAAALSHIHDHEIVHRDLSPKNVLISNEGAIKLIDFGLASRVGEAVEPGFRGTAAYACPEALRAESFGPAADLYSLGAIAYELLTGSPPFGRGESGVIQERMRGGIEPLPPLPDGIPADVRDMTMQLLEPDAARRPASAMDVLIALHRDDEAEAGASALQRLVWKAQSRIPAPSMGSRDVIDVACELEPLAAMPGPCGGRVPLVDVMLTGMILAFLGLASMGQRAAQRDELAAAPERIPAACDDTIAQAGDVHATAPAIAQSPAVSGKAANRSRAARGKAPVAAARRAEQSVQVLPGAAEPQEDTAQPVLIGNVQPLSAVQ